MKGILFQEPLYNAICEGKKTMTRRVVKSRTGTFEAGKDKETGNVLSLWGTDEAGAHVAQIKPRYKVGEIVYVKEPYIDDIALERVFYKYDSIDVDDAIEGGFNHGWKNKLFMSESRARLFLRMTNVSCEKLSIISDDDCEKEGISEFIQGGLTVFGIEGWKSKYEPGKKPYMRFTAKLAYRELWNTINVTPKFNKTYGVYYSFPFHDEDLENRHAIIKGTLHMCYPDPFVWVYEFEIVELNKL